ncbi:MAG: ATP-binding cassette domain-containing protein [Geobacter sp.]|nr:ATP-binding cassette domain-containing protein [Geobacter sp.]
MQKVSFSFVGRGILEEFDLCLEPGVNRTILGMSGVGKTTILKLLLGLLKPDSGRIVIDGTDVAKISEREFIRLRKKIAIVFQGSALFDSMTVGENVGYRLLEERELSESEIEKIVLEKLSMLGLEHAIDHYPAELSGGMKKRVAVARALAADPEYVLFDEPTTGLDPIGVYNIQRLILMLQEQGKTTLMVTHDLETAYAVSERFSFLHERRLLFDGPKDDFAKADIPAVQEFLKPTEQSLFRFDSE